jgi:hypothetical protein
VAAADAAQVEGDVRVRRHEQHAIEAYTGTQHTHTDRG